MKKAVFSKNGMKMLINTGFKTFDKQTNLITTGNVYASTQFSSYIRPWSKTECNGMDFPCGELLKYDLKPFSPYTIPIPIMRELYDETRTESLILYMFFIHRQGIKPLGWVLTDKNHKMKSWFVDYWTWKREAAMKEIIKYITV